MFVSSEKFIEAHSGRLGDISIYGQESNYTTWRLAKMNLAIRGIDAQIAHGDTFHNDRHPDLKADYVLANPPFNDSDWRGELLKDDKRWVYGVPPAGNANYAWVQHFVHHLAPTGLAGFVLANGSMSSNQSGEGEIRKAIIEADLVDRVHRELTDEDVARIAGTYHASRGDKPSVRPERSASEVEGRSAYKDLPGVCMVAKLDDIRKHGHVLTPGRYVGAEAAADDGEPFEEKMQRLAATLRQQQAEAAKLDAAITANLKELGYGG